MVFSVVTTNADALLRDLDQRNLDLLLLRKFGPFAEGRLTFEVLYDNPYFVAAGAKNPWTRQRRVELAKLIDEFWVLPPPDTRFGAIVRDIFGAKGLPYPRASVVSYDLEMTLHLLRTGRYMTIHAEPVLDFPTSIRSSGNCRSNCQASPGRLEYSR